MQYNVFYYSVYDAPPNSLMDSTTNPKVKTMEGEGIGTCSLARNTLKVEGHARALGWGLRRMTSKSTTHRLAQIKQQVG